MDAGVWDGERRGIWGEGAAWVGPSGGLWMGLGMGLALCQVWVWAKNRPKACPRFSRI